jgi:Holliday junction DNA helicase RuvB
MSNKNLRPSSLSDYIGQEELKEQLHVSIEASKKRKRQLPHVLFYGGAGLGKTTISQIMANEFEAQISFANAANIQRPADLVTYILNLEEGDFLFIDEIHRLKNDLEEILYTVMEDFRVDIVTKAGSDLTPISINLPKFTLIGATTMKGKLSQPLVDRFGIKVALREYTNDELVLIIQRSSKLMNIIIDDEAALEIAKRSRGTPRKSNQILDRITDFAVFDDLRNVDKDFAINVLNKLKIDKYGLEENDREILRIIKEQFHGGPVGLNNLAATSGEQKDTLENIIEPYLLKNKFLIRTGKGRKLTRLGREVLKNT